MKALLLCAGLGSRFVPYTKFRPKAALPFLNIALAKWPLKILSTIGIKELVVNTHHKPDQVRKVFQSTDQIRSIHFSYEPQLLEGIGAVQKNKNLLKSSEPFIYFNGDSLFLSSDFFSDLMRTHIQKKSLITFLAAPLKSFYHSDLKEVKKEASFSSFLWADQEGCLKKVSPAEEDGTPSDNTAYFFSGFALISPECFSLFQKEDSHLFQDAVKRFEGRCFVFSKSDLKFFEAGSLSCYLESAHAFLKYLFEKPSSNEARQIVQTLECFSSGFSRFKGKNYYSKTPLPESLKKDLIKNKSFLLCGEEVEGLDSIEIKGFAVIGDRVKIKKGASSLLIKESVITSESVLKKSSERELVLPEMDC